MGQSDVPKRRVSCLDHRSPRRHRFIIVRSIWQALSTPASWSVRSSTPWPHKATNRRLDDDAPFPSSQEVACSSSLVSAKPRDRQAAPYIFSPKGTNKIVYPESSEPSFALSYPGCTWSELERTSFLARQVSGQLQMSLSCPRRGTLKGPAVRFSRPFVGGSCPRQCPKPAVCGGQSGLPTAC